MDDSRTRRLAVEFSYFESYRYAQLQNRELKTEIVRVSHRRARGPQRVTLSTAQSDLDQSPAESRLHVLKRDHGTDSVCCSSRIDIPAQSRHAVGRVNGDEYACRLFRSRPSQSHSNSRASLEGGIRSSKEKLSVQDPGHDDSGSSNDCSYHSRLIVASSSSSELNLSHVLQASNDNSSLSLTAMDHQDESATEDETASLTPKQVLSDTESVLYSRLTEELYIAEATLDSDLDRLDR